MIGSLYPVISPVPESVRRLMGRERTRALSRFARDCAAWSARKAGLLIPGFEKDAQGVPLSSGGVFWSVSHKKEMAAGVVCTHPTGIDIEQVRPVSQSVFERIVSPGEAGLFSTKDQDQVFFRVFTAKEAVLKVLGVGLKGLSGVTVTRADESNQVCLTSRGDEFRVEHYSFDGYIASIVSNGVEVKWSFENITI